MTWWCTKNNAPERQVACSFKDVHMACATAQNQWCPFFYENKDGKYPEKSRKPNRKKKKGGSNG